MRTFHGRLLSAAIDSRVPLQPVAIRYLRNGEVDAIAPFIGNDDLLSHLLRLFSHEQSDVEIHLLEPIASQAQERAVLAFRAQEAIRRVVSAPVTQTDPLPERVGAMI